MTATAAATANVAPTAAAQQVPQQAAATGSTGDGVSGEVANLLKSMLKSMRTTTQRVLAATEMVNNYSYNGILLDSGATHMLRHPYHDKGSGIVQCRRKCERQLARHSFEWHKTASKAMKDDLQPIVPLGMLTQHGCKMRLP